MVGLYKNECVKIDGRFRTRDEFELATLSWVHRFNKNRLHSSIAHLVPIEKETCTTVRTAPRSSRFCENTPSTRPKANQAFLPSGGATTSAC